MISCAHLRVVEQGVESWNQRVRTIYLPYGGSRESGQACFEPRFHLPPPREINTLSSISQLKSIYLFYGGSRACRGRALFGPSYHLPPPKKINTSPFYLSYGKEPCLSRASLINAGYPPSSHHHTFFFKLSALTKFSCAFFTSTLSTSRCIGAL